LIRCVKGGYREFLAHRIIRCIRVAVELLAALSASIGSVDRDLFVLLNTGQLHSRRRAVQSLDAIVIAEIELNTFLSHFEAVAICFERRAAAQSIHNDIELRAAAADGVDVAGFRTCLCELQIRRYTGVFTRRTRGTRGTTGTLRSTATLGSTAALRSLRSMATAIALRPCRPWMSCWSALSLGSI